MELVDDESTAYVDMVFAKLSNLKTLLYDAYWTNNNNLPNVQRDNLSELTEERKIVICWEERKHCDS